MDMIYKVFLPIMLFSFLSSTPSFATEIRGYGGQSMVTPLKRVIVKRPDEAFAVKDLQKWHYAGAPNLKLAQQEHDAFVNILKKNNVEVLYHEDINPEHADAIFVHDPVLMTDQGAIILKMGKLLRRGEESALEKTLKKLNVPIVYRLDGAATAEGGDLLWLDSKTLAIGRSFRTNQAGIDQLTLVLKGYGVQTVVVDLPYDQGPDACLHLQSLISVVDSKIAVVYPKFLPIRFVELLNEKGFSLIEVTDKEYVNMATNILALAPKKVLTLQGNAVIVKRLQQAGIEVLTFKGDEISHKAEGGATCLTRPILRG